MELMEFNDRSQKFLAQVLSSFPIDLSDEIEFSRFPEPTILDDLAYETWIFNRLTGYLPHPELPDFPIKYTFFVFRAPVEVKNAYLEETRKQRSGETFDGSVIGEYYSHLFPEKVQFENLTITMKDLLEEHLYEGKGYDFARHVITTSSEADFLVSFIEVGSVAKYLEHIKNNAEYEFLPV